MVAAQLPLGTCQTHHPLVDIKPDHRLHCPSLLLSKAVHSTSHCFLCQSRSISWLSTRVQIDNKTYSDKKKKSTNERADRSLTRKRTVYPPPRPRVRYDTVRSQSIVRQPPFEIPCSNSRSHANFFWQLPVHHSKPDTGYSSRHEKDMKKIRASSFVVTQPNIHRSTIATVDADTSSLHDYNLGGLLMSSKKSKISLLTLSTIVSTSLSVMLKGGAIMMWSPRSPSTVPDPG